MDTHDDYDTNPEGFLAQLQARAERMREIQASQIASGYPGEIPLWKKTAAGFEIRKMPDDPQAILRISIGGFNGSNYFTFRGNKEKVIDLLKEAIEAIEER